jgi:hypothetical protein
VVKELLFGPTRGILVTQPWVFLATFGALGGLFWKGKEKFRRHFPVILLTVLGGIFLLWMNAGFNGWHGGRSAGPRYLCIVFPMFGILAAYAYDFFGRTGRFLLGLGVALAVLLRGLIYCESALSGPEYPLWSFYGGYLLRHWNQGPALSFLLFLLLLGGAARAVAHRKRGLQR